MYGLATIAARQFLGESNAWSLRSGMRKFLVAALVAGTFFPAHVFAADGSTIIPTNGSRIEATNFYQVRMETFTVPTAT